MPGKRPPKSGYARIAQAEEEEEEEEQQPYSDEDDYIGRSSTISAPGNDAAYAPIQPTRKERMHLPSASGPTSPLRTSGRPGRPGRRRRTNSGVDIKAINARLERWAEEIKERFTRRKIKGKSAKEEQLEIHHSVFQAPDWIRPATKGSLERDLDDNRDAKSGMSKTQFDDIVESVRTAIELGMHPKLISQGSSGSYFARNSGGKIVGVFKPKDEEPYASKNPKWTKWIHRNLFPFFFGRACLIPNLSYVSEAAAYVLDCQLRTGLVPYTDVVELSSKSFYYDYWDRYAYRKKRKPLPEKPGSLQIFLQGFKGATQFFREHPWPEQASTQFRNAPTASNKRKRRRRRWTGDCKPGSVAAEEMDSADEESESISRDRSRSRHEFWSEGLQQSFREQLEKLVILDYVMRNTDRGLDNWMIRIDKQKQEAEIVVKPPRHSSSTSPDKSDSSNTGNGYHRRNESMTASSRSPSAADQEDDPTPVPRVGAIDNSLSWPWKHPDAWRSYPFGWLFLPVSLVGRPFSASTREHFLPLLTSKDWWSDTQIRLRKVFEMDADFKERMFARQIAVMKGQAWNVVETLKCDGHGPLELCRRGRVCVWDDLVDIPVALPLERPSEEMRRQAQAWSAVHQPRKETKKTPTRDITEEDNEIDIASAAHASAPQAAHDLLGMGITSTDFSTTAPPSDHTTNQNNPFNHSRQNSADAIPKSSSSASQATNGMLSPPLSSSPVALHSSLQLPPRPQAGRRSITAGHHPRMSYEAPRKGLWETPHSSQRRRRYSLVAGRGGRPMLPGGGGGGSDGSEDGDGDLGYSAANDREVLTRKVIVERIEMVKSKPPVFSWC